MNTTFGYEQDNGSIHYIQTRSMTIDEAQFYLITRTAPEHNNQLIICKSILDYFSDETFNKDESNLRILYKLDGEIKLRRRGVKGEFVFIK